MRILVVDDDASIREFLSVALEDEGHDVRSATDGRAGLRAAAEFAPDVILLDMNMPVMNGWEFARAYGQATPPPPLAPIIVITAAGDAAARAGQLRAAGFLGKPFDLQELSDRVAQVGRAAGRA